MKRGHTALEYSQIRRLEKMSGSVYRQILLLVSDRATDFEKTMELIESVDSM